MDRREHDHKWYDRFDPDTMTFVLFEDEEDEISVPARYDVCPTCEGRGSHVNPSIDSHGLRAEDFDEDPDFREDYMRGMYDVPCAECHGLRVVPVLDDARATPEERKAAEQAEESYYAYARERAYEQRMGY